MTDGADWGRPRNPGSLRLLVLFGGCLIGCSAEPDSSDHRVDADQDCFYADEDCDDTNASVFPDAPDVWYDGVDSDCAGNDDFDADGDGVRSPAGGGSDCDDSDPLISPLEQEIWYDGVDQDCREDNDYDVDVDGFESADYGGDDCDDTDPGIWPGATEIWYDGIDSDCDESSDFDADGDGEDAADYAQDGESGDCDDADASVNTSASEIWYDGVDGDCDGADDADADADGWSADTEGGEDCDDTNASINPDQDERIDATDTDCDGFADDYGIEEDFGGYSILGSPGSGFGARVGLADFDGDGLQDLVVAQESESGHTEDGNIRMFLGGILDGTAVTYADANDDIDAASWAGVARSFGAVEDQDASGGVELLVGAPDAWDPSESESAQVGLVSMFYGMGIGSGFKLSLDSGAMVVWGNELDSEFGSVVLSVGDQDGDGLAELVMGAPGGDSVAMFLSGSGAYSGTRSAADADVTWSGTDASRFGSSVTELDDIDGDGLAELAVGAPLAEDGSGVVWLLRSEGVSGWVDASEDHWGEVVGAAEDDGLGTSVASGDFDGDGHGDLIAGAPGAGSGEGFVYVVSGSDLTEGTQIAEDNALVSSHGPLTHGYAATSMVSGADVDGDGMDDLLVAGPSTIDALDEPGSVWLLLGGTTGERSLADADASFAGGRSRDRVGNGLAMGDIDGDGMADWVMGVPGEDGSEGDEGTVVIAFSGF